MGFFSELFSIKPETILTHRKVGRLAKEHCISQSLSDKELLLVYKLKINQESFIHARNALLIKIFNLFFNVYVEKTKSNPNSMVGVAGTFFKEGIFEYLGSAPDSEQEKMGDYFLAVNYAADLGSSPERLYNSATGQPYDNLSQEAQNEVKELVVDYTNEVADFFKKWVPKILG